MTGRRTWQVCGNCRPGTQSFCLDEPLSGATVFPTSQHLVRGCGGPPPQVKCLLRVATSSYAQRVIGIAHGFPSKALMRVPAKVVLPATAPEPKGSQGSRIGGTDACRQPTRMVAFALLGPFKNGNLTLQSKRIGVSSIYTCIYVSTHACTRRHMHMHTQRCIRICISIQIYISTFRCIQTFSYVCITNTYICPYESICTYLHIHITVYTNSRRIYIFTYNRFCKCVDVYVYAYMYILIFLGPNNCTYSCTDTYTHMHI